MCNFFRRPSIKFLCCYLVLFMAGLIPVPETAWASFVHYQPEKTTESDPESLEILQTALENELITERLSELGLSSEEVIHRIEQLSPEERQIVLDGLKTIQAGGSDFFTFLLFLFCISGLIFYPFYEHVQHDLLSYEVAESDFPRYEGEIAVLVEEEPEEDSIYVAYLSVYTNKFNKEEILDWMKKLAAGHGADTIILEGAHPVVNDTGVLHWTARAYKTINAEDTQ